MIKPSAAATALTTHQSELVQSILLHARRMGWQAGRPLRESLLAKQFGVSRTPVRAALEYLKSAGFAEYRINRGYFIKDLSVLDKELSAPAGGDTLYKRLARDLVNENWQQAVSIAELAKRYDTTRSRAQSLLERAAAEGWAEKRPGYKWSFRSAIRTEADYERFYRFRETIECAALLEPDYRPDTAKLQTLLQTQQRLAQSPNKTLDAVDLFEINRDVHESIVAWSQNPFYLDALTRSNALRRIFEYTKVLQPQRIDAFAREHIEILEAIKRGNYPEASTLLRRHLQLARTIKPRPAEGWPKN